MPIPVIATVGTTLASSKSLNLLAFILIPLCAISSQKFRTTMVGNPLERI